MPDEEKATADPAIGLLIEELERDCISGDAGFIKLTVLVDTTEVPRLLLGMQPTPSWPHHLLLKVYPADEVG